MIIPNIIGGLNNQMFQYAVTKALSLTEAPLKMDASQFKGHALLCFAWTGKDTKSSELACFGWHCIALRK